MGYSWRKVWTVEKTDQFEEWFLGLADGRVRHLILMRITSLELGNFGDCKSVGKGVFELRIDHGPGYRVYLSRTGRSVQLLICGGTKSSQAGDIKRAIAIAEQLKEQTKVGAKGKGRKT